MSRPLPMKSARTAFVSTEIGLLLRCRAPNVQSTDETVETNIDLPGLQFACAGVPARRVCQRAGPSRYTAAGSG
jgi:hypothetical protein